jgi:aryl-alcohol dehydrogenase-like predicted oxidoreductase
VDLRSDRYAGQKPVGRIEEMARKRGCTPAQLAMAWVLAQGNDIVPVPGTKRRKKLA